MSKKKTGGKMARTPKIKKPANKGIRGLLGAQGSNYGITRLPKMEGSVKSEAAQFKEPRKADKEGQMTAKVKQPSKKKKFPEKNEPYKVGA